MQKSKQKLKVELHIGGGKGNQKKTKPGLQSYVQVNN